MGLFDEIGKKITQSGQETVKKAKSIAETAKINSQISDEQKTLATFYAQIGEKYYSLFKDAPAEELSQLCDRVTACIIRIAELQTEIQLLKNTRLCPKCGAVCAINVQFCSSCGAQLPPVAPPVEETAEKNAEENEQPEQGEGQEPCCEDGSCDCNSGESQES